MDCGPVGSARHNSAERVDFTNEMALADPADRRITRHAPDIGAVEAKQRHARSAPRGGTSGLGPRVARSNHDDVVHCRRPRRLQLRGQNELFHVEHSLTETESPKERVKEVIEPGATEDAIKRNAGGSDFFGGQDRVIHQASAG